MGIEEKKQLAKELIALANNEACGDVAKILYLKANKIYEVVGCSTPDDFGYMGRCYYGLAVVTTDDEEKIAYYTKTQQNFDRTGKDDFTDRLDNNTGILNALLSLQRIDEAKKLADQVLADLASKPVSDYSQESAISFLKAVKRLITKLDNVYKNDYFNQVRHVLWNLTANEKVNELKDSISSLLGDASPQNVMKAVEDEVIKIEKSLGKIKRTLTFFHYVEAERAVKAPKTVGTVASAPEQAADVVLPVAPAEVKPAPEPATDAVLPVPAAATPSAPQFGGRCFH